MSDNRITVKFLKNAPSGFEGYGKEECVITKKQLSNFKKYGVYKIEIVKDSSGSEVSKSSTPDKSWGNDDIKAYLDSKGVKYKVRDTKAELLALV